MRLDHCSIPKKIQLIIAICASAILVIGILIVFANRIYAKENERIENYLHGYLAFRDYIVGLNHMNLGVQVFVHESLSENRQENRGLAMLYQGQREAETAREALKQFDIFDGREYTDMFAMEENIRLYTQKIRQSISELNTHLSDQETKLIRDHILFNRDKLIALLESSSLRESLLRRQIDDQLDMLHQKRDKSRNAISVLFITVILSSLLFSTAISLKISRKITSSLMELLRVTEHVRKGDLKHRADVTSRDEIGTLANAFNDMTDSLQSSTVSMNYLDNVLQNLAEPLIVFDRNKKVEKFNQAALDILGYTSNELAGKRYDKIAEIDNAEAYDWRETNHFEANFIRKNGERIPVIASASAALDQVTGEPVFVVVAAQDVRKIKATELALREAKEKADEASAAKSQFLANMSHEIRTPLHAISGFSQLLQKHADKYQFPDESKKFLRNIENSCEHLAQIINNVLDLSKIESGSMTLSDETIDLHQLLSNLYHINLGIARERQVKLKLEIDRNVPEHIRGDRTKLSQVIMNLIGNAIKFTPENKGVYLHAQISGDDLNIIVQDEGIGISPERQSAIFEPFEQEDTTTTRRFGGTGLGLAISKELVELMSGKICLESTQGSGSVFTITLPLIRAEQTELAAAVSNSDMSSFRDALVLLVEDNPLNQEIAKAIFEDFPFELEIRGDGNEAIAFCQARHPDLILMDLHMPGKDGMETTLCLRELPKGDSFIIVALTADAFDDQKRKALASGFNDYLTKPLEVAKLESIMRKYLSQGNEGNTPRSEIVNATQLAVYKLESRKRVLTAFTTLAPASVKNIDKAITAENWQQLAFEAHDLKNSALAIGAEALAKICTDLQSAADKANLERIQALQSELVDCHMETLSSVQNIREKLEAGQSVLVH